VTGLLAEAPKMIPSARLMSPLALSILPPSRSVVVVDDRGSTGVPTSADLDAHTRILNEVLNVAAFPAMF
jgi:hypothetical protein